jgi:hypothetical protein
MALLCGRLVSHGILAEVHTDLGGRPPSTCPLDRPGESMHQLPAALAALLLAGSLAACGSTGETTDNGSAGESPTASESSADEPATGKGDGSGDNAGTVEITISGDEVEPDGKRIEVESGSELVLEITADAPGSLHAHTTPEQEIHYGKGTTRAAVSVDQPGVVEVESHELGVVVLQIQAS